LISAEVHPLPAAGGFDKELRLRLPSDIGVVEDAVEWVAGHLEMHFASRRVVRFNVRVALTEALSNAILYGNAEDPHKLVQVRVAVGRSCIEAEITDEGAGFDPEAVPDPTLPERLTREDGRGLFLIRRLMDEVRFNEKGNSVWMSVRRA
jgi:serine/threonine-protein kinase RsbW